MIHWTKLERAVWLLLWSNGCILPLVLGWLTFSMVNLLILWAASYVWEEKRGNKQ